MRDVHATTTTIGAVAAALILLAGSWQPADAQAESPKLPRVFLETPYPRQSGAILRVGAAGNLQEAIDRARPGDTILLPPGATFTGNFILRAKTNPDGRWIVIRSSSAAFDPGGLLGPGRRVNGRRSTHRAEMPRIRSARNAPVFRTGRGASHYRLVGLDIGTKAGVNNTNTVLLGRSSATSVDEQPSDIVIDRCYIHGNDSGQYRRGVALNGRRLSVIHSDVSNFHAYRVDSQAIAGWNGPGPFKILDNYLEAASENVMFGGADPSIPSLVPADIEIRRNLFTKRTTWIGKPYAVKYAFELKNARRVLVEGNIFQHVWKDADIGIAIMLKSANQSGNCTWCVVAHVTVRNNIVRKANVGVGLAATARYPARPAHHIRFENVLFEKLGGDPWGSAGRLFTISGGVEHVSIVHVTALGNRAWMLWGSGRNRYFTLEYNIAERKRIGIGSDGTAEGEPALDASFAPYAYRGNVLVNTSDGTSRAVSDAKLASWYPATTCGAAPCVASDWNAVGFESGTATLSTSSPYAGAAAGGRDIGADIAAIRCAIDPSTCGLAAAATTTSTSAGGDTTLLADDFGDDSLDPSRWVVQVLSGSQDASVPVAEAGAALRVGPLKEETWGSHYNGILSASFFDFRGAAASVQVVETPAATTGADMVFTVPIDRGNHYRMYMDRETLKIEKKVSGSKTRLRSLTFDPVAHRFWRIRHDAAADRMLFETAPDLGGTPGAWTTQVAIARELPLGAVKFELKAGTSQPEPDAPGTAVFDNFRAVRPGS